MTRLPILLIAACVAACAGCSRVADWKDEADGDTLAAEGEAAEKTRDFDGAAAKYRAALEKYEKARVFRNCARMHIGLSRLHSIRSEYDERLAELEAAYADATRDGGNVPTSVETLNLMASHYGEFGQSDKAFTRLKWAFNILKRAEKDAQWDHLFSSSLSIEGSLHCAAGNYEQAIIVLDEAEKTWDGGGCRFDIQNTRGFTELLAGNTARAEEIFRAMDACVRQEGANSAGTAIVAFGLAEVALEKGDLVAALAGFTTAYEFAISFYGEESDVAAEPYGEMGRVYRRMGRIDEALEHGARAVAILEKQKTYALVDQLEHFGIALCLAGRKEEGIGRLRRAIALREERYGTSHPEAIRVRKVITDLEAGTFRE